MLLSFRKFTNGKNEWKKQPHCQEFIPLSVFRNSYRSMSWMRIFFATHIHCVYHGIFTHISWLLRNVSCVHNNNFYFATEHHNLLHTAYPRIRFNSMKFYWNSLHWALSDERPVGSLSFRMYRVRPNIKRRHYEKYMMREFRVHIVNESNEMVRDDEVTH